MTAGSDKRSRAGRFEAHDAPKIFERDLLFPRVSPPKNQIQFLFGVFVEPAQFFQYPFRFFLVRPHFDDVAVESELYVFLRGDGAVFVRIGRKNRGIKTLRGTVYEINVHNCPVSALKVSSGVENMDNCSYFSLFSSSMSMVRTLEIFSLP